MAKPPQRVDQVLKQWLATTGLDVELRPYVIAQRWPRLVGPRIAARTRPGALREGTLTIEVATSAWLNELTFLREELLSAINDGLADQGGRRRLVARLRFVVGREGQPAAEAARGAERDRGGATAAPPATGAADELADDPLPEGLDPALADAIRRARRARGSR